MFLLLMASDKYLNDQRAWFSHIKGGNLNIFLRNETCFRGRIFLRNTGILTALNLG